MSKRAELCALTHGKFCAGGYQRVAGPQLVVGEKFCGVILKSSTFEYLGGEVATSVTLDDDLKRRIQHLAEAQHRSSHWIIREAVRD